MFTWGQGTSVEIFTRQLTASYKARIACKQVDTHFQASHTETLFISVFSRFTHIPKLALL